MNAELFDLDEVLERYHLGLTVVSKSKCVRVHPAGPVTLFPDLWHLKDYVVSTVSGPVVYLVPRRKTF